MPKSLNCPNCAAPLQVREHQTLALCVYMVFAVRLWLEVQPDGQPSFQAERNVILRRSSLERLATGSIIEVKCQVDRGEAIPVAPLRSVEARQ